MFIDTETSGLPKNWSAPYSAKNNWPYAVQVSWIIYTKEGVEVKVEDHYIKNSDFQISSSSQNVHRISRNFLVANGENRKDVMQLLASDIMHYKPMVLGHFMKFDYHMAGVEFYRSGLENYMEQQPLYCTMLATTFMVNNPHRKYLRLTDLYTTLFATPIEDQHNALEDARATAACFFELVKKGVVTDKAIEAQQSLIKNVQPHEGRTYKWIPVIIILLIFIILILIWKADYNF